MSLRNILLAIVLILGIAIIVKNFLLNPSSGNSIVKNASTNIELPTSNSTIKLRNYDDARAHIRKLTDEQIPTDFKTPSYITSANSKEQAFEVFAERFPMFYGFGSTQLLDSIIANTAMYEVMLTENKAIRRKFDPNGKYK